MSNGRKVYVKGILVGTTTRKPSDFKRKKSALFIKEQDGALFLGRSVTL